jgi:hypothetical protein
MRAACGLNLPDGSPRFWIISRCPCRRGVTDLAIHIRVDFSRLYFSYPFSTRAFISAYAVWMSLLRAATFVAVPGLSFTWRINLPVPCNK